MGGAYVQMTVKFPTGKERYRQAVECIRCRDKGMYPTIADYLASAILFFEGNLTDDRNDLSLILQSIRDLHKKADEILDGWKESI